MLELLRGLHNLLRWVIVLGGVYALVLMLRGLLTQAQWTPSDGTAARVFTYSLHLQLVVGVILYAITPLLSGGIGAALTDRLLLIEHVVLMLVAVVAAQLGTSLARRASTDRAKFTRAFAGYLVALVVIFWATPWGQNLIPWA